MRRPGAGTAWDVFNLTNAVQFDPSVQTLQTSIAVANFVVYSALLNNPASATVLAAVFFLGN